jgi:hypothetical protein
MSGGGDFLEQTRRFTERAAQLGLAHADRYYWYHTIDLGDGLITPGMYDYRETISSFQFSEDMRGMTVLDVGSATGFFAFEFERRGAWSRLSCLPCAISIGSPARMWKVRCARSSA